MIKRAKRWILALAIVLLAPAVALSVPSVRTLALRTAGQALVAEDPATQADIAVVPTWTGASGALEVADLVQSGAVSLVAIITGPTGPAERELIHRGIEFDSEAERLTRVLKSLGVTNVERLPQIATGTEAEGRILAEWCEQRGFRSVIVISTPDHSRRLRRVLRRSLSQDTQAHVRLTRIAVFTPDGWWKDRAGVRTAIVESQKLLLDIVRHPLSW